MKRLVLFVSHPLVALPLGFLLALGTAAQLVWRGEQGDAWA